MSRYNLVTLSELNFCQKIKDKYRMDNIYSIRFPAMIFFKNKGNFSIKEIIVDIFVRSIILNKNIASKYTTKGVHDLKWIFSWSNFEKFLQFIINPFRLKLVSSEKEVLRSDQLKTITEVLASTAFPQNKISAVYSIRPVFFGNRTITSSMTSYPSFFATYSTMYAKTHSSIPTIDISSNYLIHDYHIQIMKMREKVCNFMDRTTVYNISNQKKQMDYHYFRENKPDIMWTEVNIRRDISKKTFQNKISLLDSILIKYHTNFGFTSDDFVRSNLYFHNQRDIKQEVEHIKEIVSETKKTVIETSLSASNAKDMDVAIKRHLDINRISDQVYQNIERRIRTERERRGI